MRAHELKSKKRGDFHRQRRALDCWPSPIMPRQWLANMDHARMIEADQPPSGRGKAGQSGHVISPAGDIGDRESTRRAPGDAHCDYQPPEPLDDARILLVTGDGMRSTAAPVMSTAEGHGSPPGMFERPLSLRRDAPLIARHSPPSRQTCGHPVQQGWPARRRTKGISGRSRDRRGVVHPRGREGAGICRKGWGWAATQGIARMRRKMREVGAKHWSNRSRVSLRNSSRHAQHFA